MKVKVLVFKVTDSHGNADTDVCGDSCDTVQICGMKNTQGERIFFESDAHHLDRWCNQYGLAIYKKTEYIEI